MEAREVELQNAALDPQGNEGAEAEEGGRSNGRHGGHGGSGTRWAGIRWQPNRSDAAAEGREASGIDIGLANGSSTSPSICQSGAYHELQTPTRASNGSEKAIKYAVKHATLAFRDRKVEIDFLNSNLHSHIARAKSIMSVVSYRDPHACAALGAVFDFVSPNDCQSPTHFPTTTTTPPFAGMMLFSSWYTNLQVLCGMVGGTAAASL